jgi:hypothetical protein
MKAIKVFYAGLFYEDYDSWPGSWNLPNGAFLFDGRDRQDCWYHINDHPTPINLADVPNELRTLILLLT